MERLPPAISKEALSMKQHQQHLAQSISIQIMSRQTDPDHHPDQHQLHNSTATLYRTGTAWMAMHCFTTANIQFHGTQYALSSIPPLTAPTTMPKFHNNMASSSQDLGTTL